MLLFLSFAEASISSESILAQGHGGSPFCAAGLSRVSDRKHCNLCLMRMLDASEGKETEGLRNPDEKVGALRPFDRLMVVSKVEPQVRTDGVSTSRGLGGGPLGTGPFPQL